jgi:parvulin-like peptidyl-prolyl isomerase
MRIAEADIRAEITARRIALEASGHQLTLEHRLGLRHEATETVVERALIAEEIRRLNLANPDELIAYWGRNLKAPSTAQIRDYYREHRQDFWCPESIHASHLVKNHEGADREQNRVLLTNIREQIQAGENFATLAAAHSDCPESGGDLGFFARGVMVDEFDAVVFSSPVRQLTPIFETRFGLHLAIVHERKPEGILTLNEAVPQISEILHRMKLDREVGIRLADLKAKTKIEIA